MSFDVSAVTSVVNATLLAGGGIGGSLLAASWGIRAWRLLSGEGGARDPIDARSERMALYRELRADGWSPREIVEGGKYTGPGSTFYGP
jgi:hypothetical protein